MFVFVKFSNYYCSYGDDINKSFNDSMECIRSEMEVKFYDY